jgi:hypothetical protein
MAEVQEKVQEKVQGASGGTALKAAAAAAATGAATYAVRRAFAHDNGGSHKSEGSDGKSAATSLLASAAATGWDAAAEVLIPLAEEAAESAGRYVATHGPEIVRERIVPKFIEAFNEAR